MKLVMVGGVPACGKSTILKGVIKSIQGITHAPWERRKYGRLEFMRSGPVYILGVYSGGKFDGTDRLSMSVQPDALAFIKKLVAEQPQAVVLVEGDRLVNESFFQGASVYGANAKLFLVEASEDVLRRRHEQRRDTQSDVFLRGRRTKYQKLQRLACEVLRNEELADLEACVCRLVSETTANECKSI